MFFNEDFEVLVGVQLGHLLGGLVLCVDVPQVLIRVGENVQEKGRRVFEVHSRRLAEFDDLVHELPRLFDRPAIDDDL